MRYRFIEVADLFSKPKNILMLVCLQVDMSKVNVDTMKPWIANRITELLGLEDDVIVEFVFNQLEERVNNCLFQV